MSVTIEYNQVAISAPLAAPNNPGIQTNRTLQVELATYDTWGWLAAIFGKAKRVWDGDNNRVVYLKKADLYRQVASHRMEWHEQYGSKPELKIEFTRPFTEKQKTEILQRKQYRRIFKTAKAMLRYQFRKNGRATLSDIETVLASPWKYTHYVKTLDLHRYSITYYEDKAETETKITYASNYTEYVQYRQY